MVPAEMAVLVVEIVVMRAPPMAAEEQMPELAKVPLQENLERAQVSCMLLAAVVSLRRMGKQTLVTAVAEENILKLLMELLRAVAPAVPALPSSAIQGGLHNGKINGAY